jgi:hypothetical protein
MTKGYSGLRPISFSTVSITSVSLPGDVRRRRGRDGEGHRETGQGPGRQLEVRRSWRKARRYWAFQARLEPQRQFA